MHPTGKCTQVGIVENVHSTLGNIGYAAHKEYVEKQYILPHWLWLVFLLKRIRDMKYDSERLECLERYTYQIYPSSVHIWY